MAVQEKTSAHIHGKNPYVEDATRDGLGYIARAIGMVDVKNDINPQGVPVCTGMMHVPIGEHTLVCDVVLIARNTDYGYGDNGYGVDVTTADTSTVAAGGSATAPVLLDSYVRFNRRAAIRAVISLHERLLEDYAPVE